MNLPKFMKPFIARIAKFLSEIFAMTDEALIPVLTEQVAAASPGADVSAIVAVAQIAAASEVVQPAPAEPLPKSVSVNDFVDRLKTILSALGHELPEFLPEAVALAKKVL